MRRFLKKFWLSGLTMGAAAIAVAAYVFLVGAPAKVDIRSAETPTDFSGGQVREGANQGDAKRLATTGNLTYESPALTTESPTTNVVGIRWEQQGAAGVELNARIFDGKQWTEWVEVDNDDRKDGTAGTHSGLVLTSNAKQVQYRFVLSGNGQEVAVSNAQITYIDSTRGPDPTKPSKLSGLFGKAKATASGPRVLSRAEWGSPDPNGTLLQSNPYYCGKYVDDWAPHYMKPLNRVMIHHTVTAGNSAGSAAEVRGIWQYHTCSEGWGDIGYNYLVDKAGWVFQGRYFDPSRTATDGEVVGGHTYSFNDSSIGIAALGNFSTQGATGPLMNSIAHIAGFKLAPYYQGPSSSYVDEGISPQTAAESGTPARGGKWQYRLGGHRDYLATACPGNNLYSAMGYIRSQADQWFSHYVRWNQYDYEYSGVFVNGAPGGVANLRAGQSATLTLDLKNTGTDTWANSGPYPTRLGTFRPNNRGSGFQDGSWINAARAATFSEKVTIAENGTRTPSAASTIGPGDIGRFTFTVTAPNVGGSFVEYFQPVVENYTWFVRDVGLNWTINVTPNTYSYQLLDFSGTPSNQPNGTAAHTLTIKNTGNMAWTNTGDAATIRLGTERPKDHASRLQHSSWLSAARVGSFAGQAELDENGQVVKSGGSVVYDDEVHSIEPGQAAHFIFITQTPGAPFTGNEHFNFVVDGVAWLNDVGIYWPVDIRQHYHAELVGWSPPPTLDKSDGGTATIYLDYKNTGSYAWAKNGNVRVGTANPLDRPSSFRHSSWLAVNRVGSFAGEVTGGSFDAGSPDAQTIDPGETARFEITLDAAQVAARGEAYPEYFRLVADNFAWLEYVGEFFPVTVQQ